MYRDEQIAEVRQRLKETDLASLLTREQLSDRENEICDAVERGTYNSDIHTAAIEIIEDQLTKTRNDCTEKEIIINSLRSSLEKMLSVQGIIKADIVNATSLLSGSVLQQQAEAQRIEDDSLNCSKRKPWFLLFWPF